MAVRERVKEGAAGAVGAEAKRIDLANRANAPKTDYAGRLAMLSALLLPQFALLAAGRHSGAEQLSAWFTASVENSKEIMASPEVILGLAMFLPERFLYTFVWVAPKLYTKMVSMIGTGPMFEPIEFLFQGFVLCKGLQAGAFIQLYLRCGVPPIWETSDFSIWQMTTGISMMAVGQILNMWIYAAIGKKGVYYGCRLGAKSRGSTAARSACARTTRSTWAPSSPSSAGSSPSPRRSTARRAGSPCAPGSSCRTSTWGSSSSTSKQWALLLANERRTRRPAGAGENEATGRRRRETGAGSGRHVIWSVGWLAEQATPIVREIIAPPRRREGPGRALSPSQQSTGLINPF